MQQRPQRQPLQHKRAQHDDKGRELNKIAVRKAGRERHRCGKRHDSAHAGPSDHQRALCRGRSGRGWHRAVPCETDLHCHNRVVRQGPDQAHRDDHGQNEGCGAERAHSFPGRQLREDRSELQPEKARTFSTTVTVSQMAKLATRSRAVMGVMLPRATVSPKTTTVTTPEKPMRSAASQITKVATNWKMTELGASLIRAVTMATGRATSQPATTLPKTTSAKAGIAACTLKVPAAIAPTARR